MIDLDLPPLAPAESEIVVVDTEFAARCSVTFTEAQPLGTYEIARAYVYRTEGLRRVWRADFVIPGTPESMINRVVCSEQEEDRVALQIAIGQAVKPLESGS